MATIATRLTRFSKQFVLLPVLVLVVLINFLIGYLLLSKHNERVLRLRERAEADFRQALESVSADIYRLSVSPPVQRELEAAGTLHEGIVRQGLSVEKIIAERHDPRSQGAPWVTRLTEESPVVKALLVSVDYPAVRSLILTDHLGRLVAASSLPPEPVFSAYSWWTETKRRLNKQSFISGVTEADSLYVNMPVYLEPGRRSADGVLRVEIPLDAVLERISLEAYPENAGLVFVRSGSETGHSIGKNKEILAQHAERLVHYVSKTRNTHSWYKQTLFSARRLSLPDPLEPELNVIAFLREPFINAASLSPLVLSVLASAIVLVVLNLLGQRAALTVGEAVVDVTDAGQWLLWRVNPNRFTQVIGRTDRSVLQNEVYNTWLENVKQSVLDTMVSHEHEVQRDLQLARDFQFAYHNRPYPRIPINHVPGRLRLRFAHNYKPALALGGDFFELTQLGPDVAGVLICDVMGHGTRSALITSMLRTLMADLKSQGRNTRNFLREMNRAFYQMLQHLNLPHPLFASAYYFVADTTARAATFSTAGHPAPFHIRRAGNTVNRLQVAPPHGAALGVSLEEEYTGGSCRLQNGDVFVFYTDGVYEAFSPHGEEFGMQRLEKVMRQSIHHGLEQIVQNLETAISDFTEHEPLRDDICILAVEVTEEADTDILQRSLDPQSGAGA